MYVPETKEREKKIISQLENKNLDKILHLV